MNSSMMDILIDGGKAFMGKFLDMRPDKCGTIARFIDMYTGGIEEVVLPKDKECYLQHEMLYYIVEDFVDKKYHVMIYGIALFNEFYNEVMPMTEESPCHL